MVQHACVCLVEEVSPFQREIFPSKDKEQSKVEGDFCCCWGCGFVVVLTCVEYLETIHVIGSEVVFGKKCHESGADVVMDSGVG